jgi:nucleoside-diphosphate-sugar epimerase
MRAAVAERRRRHSADGASGFLGAFLLATLLERTRDRVVLCHVRAATAAAGLQRLERSLRAHLLWRDEYAAASRRCRATWPSRSSASRTTASTASRARCR